MVGIEQPVEPGQFLGDIWYGHPENRTMGTHKWTGEQWEAMASGEEVLIGLLAQARQRAEYWKAEHLAANAEIARLTAERDAAMAGASFQARVQPWMMACFGPEVSADRLERGDRLLEEVFELLQSGGYPKERTASLAAYVWSRDVGDPAQEVGGVMVTLAAYCLAHDLDMHGAGETELARVWTKVEAIRAKQAGKPKGSALPQVWPAALQPDPDARQADLAKAFCMGRDMAGNKVQSELMRHSPACDYDSGYLTGVAKSIETIRTLTPPADLAAKIGGDA